jgi:hypothetical protein
MGTAGPCFLVRLALMFLCPVALYKNRGKDTETFFREQYTLNFLTATLQTPYICLLNGITSMALLIIFDCARCLQHNDEILTSLMYFNLNQWVVVLACLLWASIG